MKITKIQNEIFEPSAKLKITIFGLAGTGKTTAGKLLAKELNLKFNSTGNLMRQKAKDLNLSIYEFDKLCQVDKGFGPILDNSVEDYGKNNNNFLFESRLAWHFIPDSIKIKLICKRETAYKRISKRENISFNNAKKTTIARAKNLEKRYQKLYPNIIYPPKNKEFDLIVDTTNLSIQETVEKIKDYLKKNNPN